MTKSVNFLLATIIFILPYVILPMTWWKFALAVIFVFYTFKRLFPENYLKILGLKIPRKDLFKIFLTFIITAVVAHFVITFIMQSSPILRTPNPIFSLWFLQPIFQSGNEEMVFRAAAFYLFFRFIKNQITASLILAILFVIIHLVFFWIDQSVLLTGITLLSLFFATLALNNLFLRFQHIGICLALHAGWNYQKFGAIYNNPETGQLLIDSEKFNLVEGSPYVLLVSVLIFLGSFLFLKKRHH